MSAVIPPLLITGRYVAFPACLAAWLLRTPLVLQEQNSRPGLANRALGPFASLIFTAFPEAAPFFSAARCEVVLAGNPTRAALASPAVGSRSEARESLHRRYFVGDAGGGGGRDQEAAGTCCGLAESDMLLTVLGGSQGAASLNRLVEAVLPLLPVALPPAQPGAALRRIWVLWQTGDDAALARGSSSCLSSSATADVPHTASRVARTPFIEAMHEVYRGSDLVVARAGAMTCAELLAMRTAALLVPSPHVTDDHQRCNAEALVALGAATTLPDERTLSPAALKEAVVGLLGDARELESMRAAAGRAAKPGAAEAIAQRVVQLAAREEVGGASIATAAQQQQAARGKMTGR